MKELEVFSIIAEQRRKGIDLVDNIIQKGSFIEVKINKKTLKEIKSRLKLSIKEINIIIQGLIIRTITQRR